MSERADDACPWTPDRSGDERKRQLLGQPRVVAVVGMSPKRDRPSNYVARYLKDHGFTIVPVNPTVSAVEGLQAYPDLGSIPENVHVEIVDLFVAPERTGPVVEQAARIGAKIVWFQPGAEDGTAEARARELGLEVFSGVCTKAEHSRLFGE